MRYEIEFDSPAIDDLQTIRIHERRIVVDHIERILSVNASQISKSRIKRLRGVDSPQYRLRVGNLRIFYDIEADYVFILRILAKEDVEEYLKEMGYDPEND